MVRKREERPSNSGDDARSTSARTKKNKFQPSSRRRRRLPLVFAYIDGTVSSGWGTAPKLSAAGVAIVACHRLILPARMIFT